jgi:ribosome recycling factor
MVTMSESFFIGREKEIHKLEYHLLHQDAQSSNFRLSHIWGRDGIGKSSLITEFAKVLLEENDPIVWLEAKLEDMQADPPAAMALLNQSAKSNIGVIEPWIQQIRDASIEESLPESPSENPKSWKFSILSAINSIVSSTTVTTDKLRFVVLMDDYYLYPHATRIAIARQLKQIAQEAHEKAIIGFVTSSENSMSEHADEFAIISDVAGEPLQIELVNFTRDETSRFIEAHHIDPSEGQRLYEESKGFPKQLALAVDSHDPFGEDKKVLLQKGHQMLLALNNLQRNWIKWAAIIRYCNEESLSLLTQGREVGESLNWIRSNYPVYFDREKSDYMLRPEYQKAILAVVQETESELFDRISAVIKKLQSVKNGIPNYEHRKLLSHLAIFQYFDEDLIKRSFEEQTSDGIIRLIEAKPIFFRREGDSIRLASNTRSSIALYNTLIPPERKDHIVKLVDRLWQDKKNKLRKDLEDTENELHEAEKKSRSLSDSIATVEKEVARIQQAVLKTTKRTYTTTTTTTQAKKSITPMITSVLFQICGIGLLYIETLVIKRVSLPYIALALVLMISGFFIGNQPKKPVQVVNRVTPQNKSAQVGNILNHLNIDRGAMMEQKEQLRSKIEVSKMRILAIQESLQRSYLPSADSDQKT